MNRRRRTSRTRSSVSTTSTSTSTDTRRGRRSSSRSPRPRWRESTPRRPPPRPPHTRSANAPESPTWAVAARSCLVALLVLSSREARGSAAATARVRRCVGPFISPLFILVYSHTKNPLRTNHNPQKRIARARGPVTCVPFYPSHNREVSVLIYLFLFTSGGPRLRPREPCSVGE